MIHVTIKGETRTFEEGLPVREILTGFDSQYLQYTCAVRVEDRMLDLQDTVDADCEMEPLSLRELGRKTAQNETTGDSLDDGDLSDEDASVEAAEELTEEGLRRLIQHGVFNPSGDFVEEMACMFDSLDDLGDFGDDVRTEDAREEAGEETCADIQAPEESDDEDSTGELTAEMISPVEERAEDTIQSGETPAEVPVSPRKPEAAVADSAPLEREVRETAWIIEPKKDVHADEMMINLTLPRSAEYVVDFDDEGDSTDNVDYSVDEADMDFLLGFPGGAPQDESGVMTDGGQTDPSESAAVSGYQIDEESMDVFDSYQCH